MSEQEREPDQRRFRIETRRIGQYRLVNFSWTGKAPSPTWVRVRPILPLAAILILLLAVPRELRAGNVSGVICTIALAVAQVGSFISLRDRRPTADQTLGSAEAPAPDHTLAPAQKRAAITVFALYELTPLLWLVDMAYQ
jgi:hypothetical protein